MFKFLIKSLSNLRLAILLLLLIAFSSSVGSIIEQNKNIEFYTINYKQLLFSIPIWKYILFLGLDHLYSTSWFFFLIFIFNACLLSCTFWQQLPTLKFSRRYYFFSHPNQFNKLDFKFNLEKAYPTQFSYVLNKNNYSIFQRKNNLYAYKGLIGRIGPIFVHLSIISILFGSLFGALTGFNTQEFVAKTEVFHLQNPVKLSPFAELPSTTFRVNDFWVNYEKTGLIKQFYSNISVLNDSGEEINQKTISVNKPLNKNGLMVYQTDWGISGLRVKINEKVLQLPVSRINEQNKKVWVSWLQTNTNENYILVLNNDRGLISFYDQNGNFVKTLNFDESIITQNKQQINIIDIIPATGLQIKSEPGTKIVYIGFAALIFSSLISFISFSEVWFLHDHNIIYGGKSNRAKIKFKLELLKLKMLSSL